MLSAMQHSARAAFVCRSCRRSQPLTRRIFDFASTKEVTAVTSQVEQLQKERESVSTALAEARLRIETLAEEQRVTKQVALLIDADNNSWRNLDLVMAEAANHGMVGARRIYGDWSSPSLASWKGYTRCSLAKRSRVSHFAASIPRLSDD